MPVGQVEFFENTEIRLPTILLLDGSLSLAGEPIEQLNNGIGILYEEIQRDPVAISRVELAVVPFGGKVWVAQEFKTLDDCKPPRLQASGNTPMGEAINVALDLLEKRKAQYKASGVPYNRPWIFLISDGAPTDKWEPAADRVHQGELDKKFLFYTIAVEGADMATLAMIAPPNRPPVKLNGLDFPSLFLMVSHSLTQSCRKGEAGQQILLAPTE